MNNPKISVIVPVYNVAEYLERCLNSVLEQTFKDIEIIAVNDGSTDNSLEIIKDFQRRDMRIVLIDKANTGVADTRNTGVKAASGEYLLQLDGDDWIERNYLEKAYSFAKAQSVDIVVTDFYFDYPDGSRGYAQELNMEHDVCAGREYLEMFFQKGQYNSYANILAKRTIYVDNGIQCPLDIEIGEDMIVIPQLFYYAERIGRLQEGFFHYVQHLGSAMHTCSHIERVHKVLLVLARLESFFVEKDLYRSYANYALKAIHSLIKLCKREDIQNDIYNSALYRFVALAQVSGICTGRFSVDLLVIVMKIMPSVRVLKGLMYIKRLLRKDRDKCLT